MTTLVPRNPSRIAPMALPSGVPIALYASDPQYGFEIQRATDSSGTGATSIATNVPGNQDIFIDALPLDNTARWYRIRHVGVGDTPSDWTAWTSGTPVALTGNIVKPAPTLPSFKEERSVSGHIGTLTVTVSDPQSRMTLFEFQTTEGGASPSGWSPDASAPYSTTTTITPPESKVEYRVTAFDVDGVSRIIWQTAVSFNPNALLVRIDPVSTSATDEEFDVTVTDLTGSAAVTLTHTELNATVTRNGGGADPATFTGATAGTTIRYTMTRGNYSTGKSKTVFVATAPGRIDGSDSIDLPEKPRDTVPARLSRSKTNYNPTTGKWELWIRYFETSNAGVENEIVTDGPWTGASTGSLIRDYDVRDQNGNTVIPTFPPVAFPGPSHYDAITPGWKITWPSTPVQSWSFHMSVTPISIWDGSTTVSVAPSTIDINVPAANGGIGGLDARIYGVVGDGATDDTAAVQAAFTAGASLNRYVDFGAMVVKLTGGVSCAGPGFRFDGASYGNAGDMGFHVSGSGYVALTFSGRQTMAVGTIAGTGNSVNGILFDNTQQSQYQTLRVYNLNGYGAKKNKTWDCTWVDLSIESCGNTTDYAYSMNDAGDTCNMCNVHHLQVESSNRKAIFIDGNTLVAKFGVIHCEGLTNADSSTDAVILRGAGCTYSSTRIASTDPTHTRVCLGGAGTTFQSLRIEGAINVETDAYDNITLMGCNIDGNFHQRSGGTVTVIGGNIPNRPAVQTGITYYNTL